MKIPAVKAAVDKEWEKLEKISAWNLTKVKSKKEVIDEARTKGATIHFASLMDICHLKNAELEAKHQKIQRSSCTQRLGAEMDNNTAPSRILDTSAQRLEDYSTVAKAATATAVAVDTKACTAKGTFVQLKNSSNIKSRTEAKVLHAIAQATERTRSRHRGGPSTRTTCRRVPGHARESYVPFRSADPRATRSTGQGSGACEFEGRDLREDRQVW